MTSINVLNIHALISVDAYQGRAALLHRLTSMVLLCKREIGVRELLQTPLPQEVLPSLGLHLGVLVVVGVWADTGLAVDPVVHEEPANPT